MSTDSNEKQISPPLETDVQVPAQGDVKPVRKTRVAGKAASVQTVEGETQKTAKRKRAVAKKELIDDAAGTQPKTKRVSGRKTAITGTAALDQTGSDPKVPPITTEAMGFLANENAKAADLVKLSPESQEFVRYHYTRMHRLEVDSKLTDAFLKANQRPVSPAMVQLVDALTGRAGKSAREVIQAAEIRKAVEEQPAAARAVSFVPPREVASYMPVSVELRKLDIKVMAPGAREAQKPELDDAKRVQLVMGTAHMLANLPINDVTPQQVAEMIANDVELVRDIKDTKARDAALRALADSAKAQPRYEAELARQAQRLFETMRERGENTIEPGPTKQRVDPTTSDLQQGIKWEDAPAQEAPQPVIQAETSAQGVPDRQRRASHGKRVLRLLGDATSKAGAWLAAQGKQEGESVRTGVPEGRPISAGKRSADPLAVSADPAATAMPESVARRFLKVEDHYYFPDKTHAFVDRGNKLATRGHHPEVVRALIDVAKARRWDSITVKGSDEFRRSAWLEAARSGLVVDGYKPTALDLAELSNHPTRNAVEKCAGVSLDMPPDFAQPERPVPPVAIDRPLAKFDPELERKAMAFENDKPAFVVKKYPELSAAYGLVEAARAFATEYLPEPTREVFVGMARRHVIETITAGEQVKGPKIFATPARGREVAEQAEAPASESVRHGQAARTKEVVRER